MMPSVTVAGNGLGGKVAVFATSLAGNRSSGLLNLRKQELFGRLLERLAPGSLPVSVRDAPGIWTLASVAEDGRSMLVMLNNLSGDERDDVILAFSGSWAGAEVSRVAADGSLAPPASGSYKNPCTFTENGVNGRPSYRFNGSNQSMVFSNLVYGTLSEPKNEFMIFV